MKKLGDNANATEMAKLLDKNTNTLSTILDRMEEERPGQENPAIPPTGRLVWAVMTPKGKRKTGRIHQGQPGFILKIDLLLHQRRNG